MREPFFLAVCAVARERKVEALLARYGLIEYSGVSNSGKKRFAYFLPNAGAAFFAQNDSLVQI
ncbi:hypothetical protein [Herbaspirillum huttiense]|uniref:hypothetical protein n=1 Tax=Herbaspirillum huttiense TaxID=863372 RepID=UPI0031E07EF8